MEVTFSVLNKNYSYNCESFDMEQVDGGDWEVEVDGETVYEGEFAPFKLEVEE